MPFGGYFFCLRISLEDFNPASAASVLLESSPSNRAVVLIDGQNLFHSARRVFGYATPNFDPAKLAQAICHQNGSQLVQARFYTGVPSQGKEPDLFSFWEAKAKAMRADGVYVYTRTIRYSGARPQEKGIDIRIALDAVLLALDNVCDLIIIVSTDQDFTELKPAILRISEEQHRGIEMKCAFPYGTQNNRRGIDGMDWIRVDKKTYDACIDYRDYRPRRSK